jgi:hypothetical protein
MIRVLEEAFTEMGASELGARQSVAGLTDMSPLWMKDEQGNSVLDIDKRRAPKTAAVTRISNHSQVQ